MFSSLKNMLGMSPKVDYSDLVKKGAQIIDVRTYGEFAGGHIKGSVNIPLHDLQASLSKLKKDKPIITCCASGMRSGSAKNFLKSHGFGDVHNGGGWMSLQSKLN
jgi:phage shock protein E